MKRKGLSKRTRFEVFKRDHFTCQYCGHRPPDVLLRVDHIIPVVEGGSDEMDNLTTACHDCNGGKGPVSLGTVRPVVDEMTRLEAMQEMAERAGLLRQEREAVESRRAADNESIDVVLGWWQEVGGNEEAFQRSSVARFLRELSLSDIREAVEALERKWDRSAWLKQYGAWKYFCGICWSMIREAKEKPGDSA